jgi:hypothetical protein
VTAGPRRFTSLRMAKDLDTPNRYVTIVEFPSYEAAMENSAGDSYDAAMGAHVTRRA